MNEQVDCRWKAGDKVRYWPLGRGTYVPAVVLGLTAKRVRIELQDSHEPEERKCIFVKPWSLSTI